MLPSGFSVKSVPPLTFQAAHVFGNNLNIMGLTKHSKVMADVLLETVLIIKLNQNIGLAPLPLNHINTFEFFLFFLISNQAFQWQTTRNIGLSYLKHEFTALA